jgi:hypothetical protein
MQIRTPIQSRRRLRTITKKLVLRKETLCSLTARQLNLAAGGNRSWSCADCTDCGDTTSSVTRGG